jgi:hypothetical protein
MALSDKNILITPNIGSASDPKIVFSGADASTGAQNITLQVYPTNSGTLSFEGSAGQLLSITNSLSGTIYAVNDISGIPSIEVLDTGLVKLNQYNGDTNIGGIVGSSGTRLTVKGLSTLWDGTTPGMAKGTIHLDSYGSAGTTDGSAITFGARDSTNPAQAGIYVQTGGGFGTRMLLATTDSYATGSKTAIYIGEGGAVNFPRARPTYAGNTILDAGNYSSYALPTSGGSMTGKLRINGDLWGPASEYGALIIRGTYPSIVLRSTTDSKVWLLHHDGNINWYGATDGVDSTNWTRRMHLQQDGVLYINNNIALHAGNYTSYAATSTHNHQYNVNNDWLRDFDDNANVKLYGNSRQMVFRTDGTSEYASGVGGYPFAWMYGGDSASERRMLLNTDGTLWTSNYGWLHTAFASASHTHSYLTGNQTITLSNDSTGSGATSIGVTNNYLSTYDNRTIAPSAFSAAKLRFGFTSYTNNNTSPWADYIHLRSYSDSSGGNDNLIVVNKNAIGMRLFQQAWGSSTVYSTYKDVALITISDSAPSTPQATNLWWQSSSGKLKIYYTDANSSQWVDAVPIPDTSTFFSKGGGAITGPVVTNSSLTVGGNTFSKKTNMTANGAGWDDHLNLYSSDATNRWNVLVDSGASNRLRFAYNNSEKFYINNDGSAVHAGTLTTPNHYINAGSMLYSDHGTWAGEYNKIQWHGNNLYLQNAGGGYLLILRRGDGGERFYCDYAGNVTASGNITAYSDARLKTNVKTIENPITLVKSLRGVTFDWIESGEHSYGLIAQEVEEVIPELVMENDSGTADGDIHKKVKSVDYSKLVSVLIEAVKNQQEQIEELRAEIKAIRGT